MGRDPHDDPPRAPRRREAAPPVPTLEHLGPWVHVDCAKCHHSVPMALAPFVIRWGFGVSSDRLRHSARCAKCGHLGATLRAPSWVDSVVGFQPFPTPKGTRGAD